MSRRLAGLFFAIIAFALTVIGVMTLALALFACERCFDYARPTRFRKICSRVAYFLRLLMLQVLITVCCHDR